MEFIKTFNNGPLELKDGYYYAKKNESSDFEIIKGYGINIFRLNATPKKFRYFTSADFYCISKNPVAMPKTKKQYRAAIESQLGRETALSDNINDAIDFGYNYMKNNSITGTMTITDISETKLS